jgi:hypothetical protein
MSTTSPDSKETVSEPAKHALRPKVEDLEFCVASLIAATVFLLMSLVQEEANELDDWRRVQAPALYTDTMTEDAVITVVELDQIAVGLSDCHGSE